MTPEPLETPDPAIPPDPVVDAAPPVPAHQHAWSMLEFELADGRPMVRTRCAACGLVRRSGAWERYWDPDAPPGPGLTEPGSTAKHPSPDATPAARS